MRFRNWGWIVLPLLALVFALNAGRNWPVHLGPGFPRPVVRGSQTLHPPGRSATFSVYSESARPMCWQATLLTSGQAPERHLRVTVNGRAATLEEEYAGNLLSVSAPLQFIAGQNAVVLTFNEGSPFCVEALELVQPFLTTGNFRFSITLLALAVASFFLARRLGAKSPDLIGGTTIVAFLAITATATVLSFFHQLTGEAWMISILILSAAAIFWGRHKPEARPDEKNLLRGWEIAFLTVMVCPIFVLQILHPISKWDDLMYHGSRAAYWLENASALPFLSHDDRLSVFPLGGDLLFAFGAILSHSEMPGKFVVFLAYPLTLFSMLALLRKVGVSSPVALGAVTIFATTPLVLANAIGIKPDLWLVLMGVLTVHFVLTARRASTSHQARVASCFAAAAAGAALGIKWTAAPLLVLAPLLIGGRSRSSGVRPLEPMIVFLTCLALGGAGPILLFNLRASHHPFGSQPMRALHQPPPGWHPLLVHLERLPLLLVGVPIFPNEKTREAFLRWETLLADQLGATAHLEKEGEGVWPGLFSPQREMVDDRFSLAWICVAGAVIAGACLRKRWTDLENRVEFWLLLGLSVVFGVAILTQTRWQSSGAGLPERFLLPSLAFGLLAAGWAAQRIVPRGKIFAVGAMSVVLLHALPYLLMIEAPFRGGSQVGWRAPVEFEVLSEFDELSRQLPPGRQILFVGAQGSRDYPLFRATEGFANRVVPWGKSAFDATRFSDALHRPGIDTVIIAGTGSIDMIWDPPINARPFIQEMMANPAFQRFAVEDDLAVFLRK